MHPELARLERFYLDIRAAVAAGQLPATEGIARVNANTIRDANGFAWMVSATSSTPEQAKFVVVGVDGTLYPAEPHQFQPAAALAAISAPAFEPGPQESFAPHTVGYGTPSVDHDPHVYPGAPAAGVAPHAREVRQGFQHQPQPSPAVAAPASQGGLAGYVEQFRAFPTWMKAVIVAFVVGALVFTASRIVGSSDKPANKPATTTITAKPKTSATTASTKAPATTLASTAPLATTPALPTEPPTTATTAAPAAPAAADTTTAPAA